MLALAIRKSVSSLPTRIMAIELIILSAIGVFILVFVATAFLEKQHLHDFVPESGSDTNEDSSYFRAMNSAAAQAGFTSAGVFVQDRSSKLYEARIALWISPDNHILLCVGGGKTARVPIKRTILVSIVEPDRIYQTQDDFGMADLSGLTSRKVVLNADLDELIATHRERIASCPGALRSFRPGASLADWDSIKSIRAQQMAQLGLIKFQNREETIWRHTLKGAWLQYYKGLRGQLAEGKAQMDRIHKVRPGAVRGDAEQTPPRH